MASIQKIAQEQANRTGFGALARGFGQGLTFNFSDEIYAFLKTGKTSGTEYEKELQKVRASFDAYKDQFPKSYIAGDIAGTVAPALLPGTLLASGLARGAGTVARAGRVAGAGAIGGAESMLAGYGADRDEYTGTEQGMDAVFGIALGSTGYVVGAGLKKPIQLLSDYVKRYMGKKASKAVENNIQKIADDTDMPIEEIIYKIGNGEILAEMNETTRAVARHIRTKASGTKVPKIMQNIAENRAKEGRQNALSSLQSGLAPNVRGSDVLGDFTASQRKDASTVNKLYENIPNYKTFGRFKEGLPELTYPELEGQLQEVILRFPQITKQVERLFKAKNPTSKTFFKETEDGIVKFTKKPTLEEAELILQNLRERAKKDYRAGNTAIANEMNKFHKNLRNFLDEVSPELGVARKSSSMMKAKEDAFKLGSSALSSNPAEFRQKLIELSRKYEGDPKIVDEIMLSIRQGAMSDIKNRSGKASRGSLISKLANDEANENMILRQIFPEDQYNSLLKSLDSAVNRQALSTSLKDNSHSIDLLTGIKRLDTRAVSNATGAMMGNPDAISQIINDLSKRTTGLSEDELLKLAQLILTDNPNIMRDALTTQKGLKETLEQINRNNRRAGGVVSGMASTQSPEIQELLINQDR